ncbi:LytTR family transcriptional regulator DNA-binding domain-containing protein [Emticicia fontis]
MNILRAISITSSHILNFVREQILALNEAFRLPMATSIRSWRGLLISSLVGLFVAIIAVGIQPFGLDLFNHEQKTELLLGFGGVAFFAMLIIKFALPTLFPKFYNKQNWTIARQSLHFLAMVLLITSLMVIYGNILHIITFKIRDILKVFALSIIPVIVTTFIQQKVFQKKFAACAELINQALHILAKSDSGQTLSVLVLGEKTERLSLLPNQFIYAETAKDSADIYWQNFMGIEKTTIHADVEKELSANPQFIHLNKSIIVNIRGILKVEGNARGYQVRIARTSREIAVPWRFHKSLEKLVQVSKVA